jgi:hypothetical protein
MFSQHALAGNFLEKYRVVGVRLGIILDNSELY